MDPYTPLRARSGARKKNLGLSAKEYTKVQHSLANDHMTYANDRPFR